MRAAPLSEVKKTNVFSAILRSLRRFRIFPTLSSISRTASPYLRETWNICQVPEGISVIKKQLNHNVRGWTMKWTG